MKKRFLVLFSIVFVFGLFATAFALSGSTASAAGNAVSCPMQKNQMAQAGDDCCLPGAACCKGGSCCHKMKK